MYMTNHLSMYIETHLCKFWLVVVDVHDCDLDAADALPLGHRRVLRVRKDHVARRPLPARGRKVVFETQLWSIVTTKCWT